MQNLYSVIIKGMLLIVISMAFPAAVSAQKQNGGLDLHTPRYYASRAENYQESEAWDASKREIDEGLKLYPNDPDLRYLNGRYYYYAVGDLQQARYNLVKAVQENDQHFRAKRILVDVEDDSKHFSSAICYINELLEFQPYDRDLWRRKISLYTKIGQKTEADQALERLARIFPDDSIVKREFANRNQEAWNKRLQSSSLTDAAANLEKWIDIEPDNIDYYIELVKTYMNMGDYDKAIGAANRGLIYHPSNQYLIRTAASLMAELGNYTRAIAFLREKHVTGPLYLNMIREAANDARWKDPYEANGRLYAASGDRDALNYLINTALTRGYYSDALDYLNEAYRKYGKSPQLLMKQYALEKRMGNTKEAMAVLEELYGMIPTDPDIIDDYTAMMITLANNDIEQNQWEDAYNHLNRAISLMTPASPAWPAAISRQISVLGRLNKFADARLLYKEATDSMPQFKNRFGYAYEEIAAVRIKNLIENENYNQALEDAEALLTIEPESEVGLRTAINMAQTLKKNDLFIKYADLGYSTFPDQPYFIIKKAVALQSEGNYEDALGLLKPKERSDVYINPQLLDAYLGMSEEYAGLLIKAHKPDLALEAIDFALEYGPENKELLYLKGIAYEQMKDFGNAWYYQHKYYDPSNAEQAEWYQHMRYLKFRSYKNHIDVEYTGAFHDSRAENFSAISHLYSIGSIAYSHLTRKNTYTGTIRYKGVDGYQEGDYVEKGGFGMEFMFQWDHVFNHRWSGMVNASYSNQFFNKLGANLGVTCYVGRGWNVGLKAGYKLSAPMTNVDKSGVDEDMRRYNILILTPSAEKSWEKIKTSLAVDVVGMGKGIYYNVGWKGKVFVNEDNISSVGLMAGFGSFPELNFFDQFFNRAGLNTFSHVNAMAGIEGIALLTNNFFISVAGTWNTYYNSTISGTSWKDFYKNVFGLSIGLHVAF